MKQIYNLVLLTILLILASGTAQAQSHYYVDQTNRNDSNNGLSWANAKQFIGAAITIAYPPTVIHVAMASSGAYHGPLNLPSFITLLGEDIQPKAEFGIQ
jgi:hypothetical protein